jgi:hypothetical protein
MASVEGARIVLSVGFWAACEILTSALFFSSFGVEICAFVGFWPLPATIAANVVGVGVRENMMIVFSKARRRFCDWFRDCQWMVDGSHDYQSPKS